MQTRYCLCTLALGKKYRALAKRLAEDLQIYAPHSQLLILTDRGSDFSDLKNTIVIAHQWQGVFNCYNDKRFAVEKALEIEAVALFLDADTSVHGKFPETIKHRPGLTTTYMKTMAQHSARWLVTDETKSLALVASRFGVTLEESVLVLENLYMVGRDHGRELTFLKVWGIVARALELQGFRGTDGYSMGLAANIVGWQVASTGLEEIDAVRDHIYVNSNSGELQSLPAAVRIRRRIADIRKLCFAKLRSGRSLLMNGDLM